MGVQIATLDFEIHPVPYYELHITNPYDLVIEFNDVHGNRLKLTFSPYQAIRITAEDCFDLSVLDSNYQRRMLEITESKWLAELRNTVASRYKSPHLTERAHHYVMDFGFDYVEVLTWEYSISRAEEG
jgi:hypothetical protein